MQVEHYHADAIRGSTKLRNALFRLAGYSVPRKPRKHRKPAAPAFVAPHRRSGRPKGSSPEILAEIERIKIYASSACHIRIENLRGDRRGKFARARHIAMYVARKATDVSYPELGRAFGRDHTTVIYAVRSVQKLVDAGDARVIRALNVIHASITR